MALDLDLTAANSKLARAREHADTLQRETVEAIKKEPTHAVRVSEVDPQTGWCDIALVPQGVKEPRLSVILGDVIHNLRSALDYVVTALAEASDAKLSSAHQFPIYKDAADYAARVGTPIAAKTHGPLHKITHSLAVIEAWQPYRRKPDPRTDPLWGIHRFSNADKHRAPSYYAPIPIGKLGLSYKGIPVEQDILDEVEFAPDKEIPVGRIRFDPPRIEQLRVEPEVSLEVRFVTPAFGGDADLTIPLGAVGGIVSHVAKLLDSFRDL
jgi:hypothetical protein